MATDRLTRPQLEMLRHLVESDEACVAAGVTPRAFWATDGLGGARVSKALERRGLVTRGNLPDGYFGARATRAGRAAWEAAKREGPRK